MERFVFILVCFLLISSALFLEDIRANKPELSSERWGHDVRIGDKDSVNAVVLDVDYSTGNLFAVLQNTENGTDYWTVSISTDTGKTWMERGFTGPGIVDIDAAVLNNYFYLVYAIGNRALIRRFNTSDGSWDVTYGTDTVFSGGANIREIALISEEDASSPQRLYCFAILNNNSLRYFNSNETVTSWGTTDLGITNADRGLDACYNEGYGSRYAWCSYFGTNDSVYIEAVGVILNYSYGPLTDYLYTLSAISITSIGAYRDTVMVLYPYRSGEFDYSIKSYVSYDGGNSWDYEGILFSSHGSQSYSANAITARKGDGFGVVAIYDNYGYFRRRSYPPGLWSATGSFTDYSVWHPVKPAIERIATNSYGIVYVDYPTRGARFDISQWPSGIEENSHDQTLLSVTPSLFSSRTSIGYILGAQQNISLDVYDILGNHVITLASGDIPAGSYSACWDGKDASGKSVASGMYFCVLKANEKNSTSTKITLIK